MGRRVGGLSGDCVVVGEGLEGLEGELGGAGASSVGCVSSVLMAHVLRCLAMAQGVGRGEMALM